LPFTLNRLGAVPSDDEFGYLRVLGAVSKMISSFEVTAIPIRADRGVPVAPAVLKTASLFRVMNR